MCTSLLGYPDALVSSPLEAHDMPTEQGWLTTAEAAQLLGLSQETIKGAIFHGKLKAINVARINMVTPEALEEYRREHLGQRGWDQRRAPGYEPDPKRKARRERMKARRQQPTAEPAEKD
jgi:excisionase family DNA binding protein